MNAATAPTAEIDRAHDAWMKATADVKKYTDAIKALHQGQREGDEKQWLLSIQQRTELQAESPLRKVSAEYQASLREVRRSSKIDLSPSVMPSRSKLLSSTPKPFWLSYRRICANPVRRRLNTRPR